MNIKLANERKAKHYSEGMTLFYREIKLQYSVHSATGWPILYLLYSTQRPFTNTLETVLFGIVRPVQSKDDLQPGIQDL